MILFPLCCDHSGYSSPNNWLKITRTFLTKKTELSTTKKRHTVIINNLTKSIFIYTPLLFFNHARTHTCSNRFGNWALCQRIHSNTLVRKRTYLLFGPHSCKYFARHRPQRKYAKQNPHSHQNNSMVFQTQRNISQHVAIVDR